MNRELLMLVDAISREKNVERDVVFGAVEDSESRKRSTCASPTLARARRNGSCSSRLRRSRRQW